MLNMKNTTAKTLYHKATKTNRDEVIQCGMACRCETCMYAQYPADYELTGYHLYCTRQKKEVV